MENTIQNQSRLGGGKFKRIIKKIFFSLFGLLLLIILAWYFLGDSLVFALLKLNTHGESCNEACGFARGAGEQNLIWMANHRPWVKNKLKGTILNQKQPDRYRRALVDTYGYLVGDDQPIPQDFLNLLKDPQTPPETKYAIIGLSPNAQPTQETIDIWHKIIMDENEGELVRRAAFDKISTAKDETAIPLLIELIKNSKNSPTQYQAAGALDSVLRDVELKPDLIQELTAMVYDSNIHSAFREYILEIFAYSKNKDFAKEFILKIYNDNKNFDKFIRLGAAKSLYYLDYNEGYPSGLIEEEKIAQSKIKYPFPIISDQEWQEYGKTEPTF